MKKGDLPLEVEESTRVSVVGSVLINKGSLFLVEGFVFVEVADEAVGVLPGVQFSHAGGIAGGEVALDGAVPFLKLHEPHVVMGVVTAKLLIVSEELHEA